MNTNLLVQYLPETDKSFPLPAYQTAGSAGLDIRAYLPYHERNTGKVLKPRERLLISSGFKIEIPDGYEGQIRARSGLALKYGITLANGVGTLDSDYRGAVGVVLINLGSLSFTIKHAQRVAQLVIARYERVNLEIANDLSKTQRNDSGYGSTGKF